MTSPPMAVADAATGDKPVAARTTVAEKIETAQSKVEQLPAREIQTIPVSQERPRAEIESPNSFESVSVEKPITLAADNTDVKTDLDVSERVEVKTVELPVPAEQSPGEPHATTQESSDVEFANPVEREVLVRQYLREVREWVAASPDTEVFESPALAVQKPESVAFTVERESIPTIQPELRDQIDVHDMNLSIGNISIVIEEPSPAAAAVIAPPPTPPPAQPQTRREPTSLSRYYLRSW